MKPMNPDSYVKPLVGRRLLTVGMEDYTWSFGFGDGIALATESAWRLIEQGRIVVSSDDHDQKFGLPAAVDAKREVLSRVGGLIVESASVATDSGDLTIRFPGGAYLQLLQLSSGYESWRISADGSESICMGGGSIAHGPLR